MDEKKNLRKSVIVIIKEDIIEVYTNLKDLCESRGFVYNTIRIKKMPFEHEGWFVNRVPFNKRHDEVEKKEEIKPNYKPKKIDRSI